MIVRTVFLFSMLFSPLAVINAYAQPKSLVIGIDGMGFGEQGFSVASTPNMDSLINGTWKTGYNGAYGVAFAGGVAGESTEQPTSSGPGWATIFSGVWADRHDVYNASFTNPDFENNPTYFETLEENVPNLFSVSIAGGFIRDDIIATVNDGNSRMDVSTAAPQATAYLNGLDTNLPIALFVYDPNVDGAGHTCGTNGLCYSDAITEADEFVGELLDAIAGRPNFAAEDWQIIVTSDHGHLPDALGHGGQSDAEKNSPLIVSSKSITQGSIQSPNQYGVSNADVAPTVLAHFGLPIPDRYFGSPVVGVSVPEPTSATLVGFAALLAARRQFRQQRRLVRVFKFPNGFPDG